MLLGRPLERFEAPRLAPPFPAVGSVVDRIEARGKHLLLRFSDGLTLHTHQRMSGSWHLYRPGEAWGRGAGHVRAVVAVPGVVAVCFDAPVVELLDDAAVARHPVLRALGPDLTDEEVDLDAAVARMARLPEPDAPIVEVLLDQRIASGIGNVYASEVCFLHGTDPRTPLHAVPVDTRRQMLDTAARLLRRNLVTTRRTTVPGAPDGSLWVYGRGGEPCRRCRTTVASGRVGRHARITTWCPRCQPPSPMA